MIHAHERLIVEGQKSVTTVCGVRVQVKVGGPLRSVIITPYAHLMKEADTRFDCVGCKAIIAERSKDPVYQ